MHPRHDGLTPYSGGTDAYRRNRYAQRAGWLRALAQDVPDSDERDVLLKLATQYETMLAETPNPH